jgi:anaerobic magnesium-protoporphyrin IX monomethyl ester cyclase
MRILLIHPPFYRFIGFYNRYFPIGLVNIGTVLRDAGHQVAVYDADYNDEPSMIDYTRLPEHFPEYLACLGRPDDAILNEVRDTLQRIDPELIGISIWTTYAASAFHVAQIARELFPDRPIVMGGPHASARADEVLRVSQAVDYVVRGEGERTILELVGQIESGHGDPAPIPGVSCRRDGQIRHGPTREKCRNLDEFPIPDRTLLLNPEKYTSLSLCLHLLRHGGRQDQLQVGRSYPGGNQGGQECVRDGSVQSQGRFFHRQQEESGGIL